MAKEGYCRICGCYGILTEDHVPPKGASILNSVEIKTLTRHFSKEADKQRSIIYQNGVYYPTLCNICNNDRLGRFYDPALIDISKKIRVVARVKRNNVLALPPKITFPMKVQKVARAIVGHLLAVAPKDQFGEPLEHARFPDAMRNYFLDPLKPLPDEMNIYYWLYPSNLVVIVRGFGICNLNWNGVITADVIKFFPLAFLITWEEPLGSRILQSKLITDRAIAADDEKDVEIPLCNIPSLDWPEQNPGDTGFNLLVDERTFVAYERKPKRHPSTGSKR